MRRSTRIALSSGVATVLCALALGPVFAGFGWFWQSLGAIAVVGCVGEGARRVIRPALAPPLQLAALVGYVTVLYARDEAVLGVLPGEEAWGRLLGVARAAFVDMAQQLPPIPSHSAIVALTVAGIGLVGLCVDVLAVTLGRAAIAGLPLLVLYTVSVGILADPAPLLFLAAGAGYVGLLLAEGRNRLVELDRSWGPTPTTEADLPAEDHELSRLGALRTGRRIGAVVLAGAVVVPALLPGAWFSEALVNPREVSPDSWGGNGPGSVTTVNPMVSLFRDLNRPRNIPLMRVQTTNSEPRGQYLTLTTLDQFDGEQWTPSQDDLSDVPDRLPMPEGLAAATERQEARTDIEVLDTYRSPWLPLPQPATEVDVAGEWLYDEETRAVVGSDTQTTEGIDYTVTSLSVEATAEQLTDAPAPPEEIAEHYTQLPDDLPPVVEELARQVTRGRDDPYEQARALQEWFLDPDEFRYDTTVTSGQTSSALAEFLRDRVGYCQQFAATMAVMARLLDIPARVAVGFTPGTLQADGSYVVGAHDAHAWPELYFADVGWVRFEPTPTIDGGRGSIPEWTEPDPAASQNSTPSTPSTPTNPAPDPTTTTDETAGQTEGPPSDDAATAPVPTDSGGSGPNVPLRPLAVAASTILLAATPMLARTLMRRRRRLSGPDPLAHTAAAWDELRDASRDLGYTWPRASTVRQVAAALHADAGLDQTAGGALYRVVQSVELARYGPAARSTGNLFADVDAVRHALAARTTRGTRWRATLLPSTVFGGAVRAGRRLIGCVVAKLVRAVTAIVPRARSARAPSSR